MKGTIYILHFDPPYRHARHYVGFVHGGRAEVFLRIKAHLAGRGARLIEVVNLAGHQVLLGRVFRNMPKTFERRLKKRDFGRLEQFCKVCGGSRRTPQYSPKSKGDITDEIPF